MTNKIFMLDVPENEPIAAVAANDPDLEVTRYGPYFVVESSGAVVIDRRSTGARHAVWYSCVGGLQGCRIVQWDKDVLRAEAR